MLILEDIADHQTAWEKANDIKGGLPLWRRSSFPKYLSTEEIASLLFETSEERISGERLLRLAIEQKELRREMVIGTTEPVDFRGVVINLHRHIRLLEEKFKHFQEDIVRTLQKNVSEIENDIYATRDSCAATLRDEIEAITQRENSTRRKARIRSGIFGTLTTSKTRIPLRKQKGIGYGVKTQSKTLDLIDKDDMESWLRAKNEWPLPKNVALSRWFVRDQREGGKLLINSKREMVLKMVANDLRKQDKNPLAFEGRVEDVFQLCKDKAVSYFGNSQGFNQINTWRTGYWHKRTQGIIQLADSRSQQSKS